MSTAVRSKVNAIEMNGAHGNLGFEEEEIDDAEKMNSAM